MWRKKNLEALRLADKPRRKEEPSCCFSVADKLCQLQKSIDEYERFLGDVLVMLSKGVPQCVVEHDVWEGDWIWDHIRDLIQENKELKAKLALSDIESKIISGKEFENPE